MTSTRSGIRFPLTCLLVLALAACTAQAPTSTQARPRTAEVPAAAGVSQDDVVPAPVNPAPRTKPAPSMSDPLPPEVMPAPNSSGTPPAIARTCRTDADCVVKDVGSCCGAMPACVNRNSRADPAAVQVECARKGLSSVCGFNEITSCTCTNGQCASEQEPVGGWINGVPAPQVDR